MRRTKSRLLVLKWHEGPSVREFDDDAPAFIDKELENWAACKDLLAATFPPTFGTGATLAAVVPWGGFTSGNPQAFWTPSAICSSEHGIDGGAGEVVG